MSPVVGFVCTVCVVCCRHCVTHPSALSLAPRKFRSSDGQSRVRFMDEGLKLRLRVLCSPALDHHQLLFYLCVCLSVLGVLFWGAAVPPQGNHQGREPARLGGHPVHARCTQDAQGTAVGGGTPLQPYLRELLLACRYTRNFYFLEPPPGIISALDGHVLHMYAPVLFLFLFDRRQEVLVCTGCVSHAGARSLRRSAHTRCLQPDTIVQL